LTSPAAAAMQFPKLLLATAAALHLCAAANPFERARGLVDQMTLDEKISFLWGKVDKYVGEVPASGALDRLGVPSILMNDGPQGFRSMNETLYDGTTTAWPAGLTMAASFDRALLGRWGAAMGAEFRAKGANVQLGPGVCVARVPVGGRNFEYISGEDPYLGAQVMRLTFARLRSMSLPSVSVRLYQSVGAGLVLVGRCRARASERRFSE
jgi:beta-glucosidase